MDQREKTILIWVLSCAGLLLLLLYSPWGSPDLYSKKIYFAENQGVNFSTCGIKNAYKGEAYSSNYGGAEIKVPDYYAERNKQAHYASNATSSSSVTTNRIIAINRSNAGANLNNRVNSNNTASNSQSSGNSRSFSSSSTKSQNSNSSQQISGQISGASDSFKTSTVDLSIFSDSTALLASNTAQKSNSLDPGLDDPLGEPIPIPEGWSFLIFMAVAYSGYIFVKNKKAKQTSVTE